MDPGICEQQAVTMAAGLAKGGCRPVFGVVSTFVQRAYDQISHDVGINRLPVTFVEFYGGATGGMNDVTHLGFFDIAMISNIPNIVFLAPANADEYVAMLDWAVGQTGYPVVIRTPGGRVRHADGAVNTDFFRYDTVAEGSDVAIIAEGNLLYTALEAADILRSRGISPTVINPRILSQVDTACLDSLKDYRRVITMEDGIVDGGFGQKVAAYLGNAPVRVTTLGLRKEFIDKFSVKELLDANGLTAEKVADAAME